MPRKKRPPSSFNSRLLLALEQGCAAETRLPCANAKEAIRLRYEINALRAAMRDHNTPDWHRFYEAGLYIDRADPRIVIIKPKGGEFKSVLDAAGIPATGEGPAPLAPPTVPEPKAPEENAIDKFLADLKNLR